MQKRILLTDDDELVLIAMEELLHAEGYAVETASSGRQCLELLTGPPYDLLVMDVIMPGMQGFELCRTVRELDGYGDIPIIMLTAKSGEEDRRRGMESGASMFLPKPIDPVLLLSMIEQTLGADGAAERA